ncbi:hypothetical protein D3C76_1063130 [compost metagenome]
MCWTTTPVVWLMASDRLPSLKSSICWRVTTETDCGVSLIDRFRRVAVLMAPVVYDSVFSVVLPRFWAVTLVAPSMRVDASGAGSVSDSASRSGLSAAPHRPRVKVMERVIGANIAADSLSSRENSVYAKTKEGGGI